MGLEWLALVMFVLFFVLILYGYPVAFSFAGTAFVFMLIGWALGIFNMNWIKLLPNRWFGTMSDFTLLAIIFFVFMGAIFEKSGLAERLLTTVGILLGSMRGGLALAVVLVGTLLAAATGVVAATVIVMGLLSLPIMLRYGYDHKLATGIITASGTMAQLLPPSLVLVVLSDQIGVGVGDLFLGALIPGLILSSLYALYVIAIAIVRPQDAPALPPEARTVHGMALMRQTLIAVVPPVFLILAVLGSIFQGIATPTEAGAVGAIGACILTALNRNLTWKMIRDAARSTANITALVIMILFCSTFFRAGLRPLGGPELCTEPVDEPAGRILGIYNRSQYRHLSVGHQSRIHRNQLHRHAFVCARCPGVGFHQCADGLVRGDDGDQLEYGVHLAAGRIFPILSAKRGAS